MKPYNLYTVKTTSRAGSESLLKMYCLSEEVQEFYKALGQHQDVVSFEVVFRKPRNIEHFNNYIGSV